SSYASKLNANITNGNKLFFVPTCTNNKGDEVVRFEELVKEGCEKWKYNICGYFAVCRMFVYELKYNIRRMWGRYGLKDIVVDADEMCFFKFKSEEQKMNFVLDQSPWLVNRKPMIVQKWDPEAIIVKEAPCKIPIWIKLFNVPLEAWSIKGISTISSRLGMPVKMDNMTAEMCKEGSERLGYARVLVEIDAGNYIPTRREQFNENVKHMYQPKNQGIKQNGNEGKDKTAAESVKASSGAGKTWNISKENVNELKRSANKYAVLAEEDNVSLGKDFGNEFADKRLIVDEFIKKKLQPTATETKDWNYDMLNYFKYQWKAMERKEAMGNDESDEEDVYVNQNGAIHDITENEVRGKVFGNWRWISNVQQSPTSCRIVIGWNTNVVDIMLVHCSSQDMLCKIEDVQGNIKLFVSFVYALNSIPEAANEQEDSIVIIPNGLPRKKKSFRFVNYVADKSEFLDIVKKGWDMEIDGCNMFKVVKRMRYLKKALNDLNRKNGNLFDNWMNCNFSISGVSGLLPNLNKSTIFFGSIDEGLKRELLQILPFKLGSLPMKYLGVPLRALVSMASQFTREWSGIQQFPAATQDKLLELLGRLKEKKKDKLTILVMGKGGVGKSSTVNSIIGERVVTTSAFQSEAPRPTMVSRERSGFTLNIIDTPGIVEAGYINDQALEIIKRFLLNKTIDVLLYVDRLDTYRVDTLDGQVVKAITKSFGQEIWRRAIVVFTHAQLSPPDCLTFDEFLAKRSDSLLKVVYSGARFKKQDIQNIPIPVSLVENSGRCKKNENDEKILPNGTAWIPSIVETITKVALTETEGIVVDQKLIDGPDPNDKWKLFIPLILAFQVFFVAQPMLRSIKNDIDKE
nr:translocase of chloroplast 34, chloroplastic isoform X2 [Tanacetum cinerariifolium]